jgi:hypothetical protein
MLPAEDHNVQKLLAAVPQVVPPNLTQTEKDAVLSLWTPPKVFSSIGNMSCA